MEEKLDEILERVGKLEKHHTRLSYVTEWIKLLGGVFLGIGGVMTAFLQYGFSQAKLERAEAQVEKSQAQIEKAEAQIKAYELQINELEERRTALGAEGATLLADMSAAKDVIAEAMRSSAEIGACTEKAVLLSSFEDKIHALDVRLDAAADKLKQFEIQADAASFEAKKIFVHIADERDRKMASEVEETLEKYGHTVPGIQNVSGKANIPRVIEVRYFRFPKDQEIAREILNLLQQHHGAKDARLVYFGRDPAATRAGHIEVWFPGRE